MRLNRSLVSGLPIAALAALIAASAPLAAAAADKTVLVLLAASSSKTAVDDAIKLFEKKHPDVTVQASYAGSAVIAAQIKQGAAADVVFIADPIARSLGSSLDGVTPAMRNHTAVIVAKSAAGKVRRPADLAAKGVHVGGGTSGSNLAKLDGETVEKLSKDLGGDFAAKYAANVTTTKTDNAKMAAAVAAGAVDAAILFSSDMVPGETVEVALPEKDRVEETHSIGVVKTSAHAAMAKELAGLFVSPEGQAILRAHHHDSVR